MLEQQVVGFKMLRKNMKSTQKFADFRVIKNTRSISDFGKSANFGPVRNRKAISDVVTTVMIIMISIVAIVIFWSFTSPLIKKSPVENSICLEHGVVLEKACYLNENEIKVIISRGFDQQNIQGLIVSFSPSPVKFKIQDKKCADVRTENGGYGSYCSVLGTGSTRSYVFNMQGVSKESSVGLIVDVNGIECVIGKVAISEC